MSDTYTKPPGYENNLSNYKSCLFDSFCGEPVAWGFEIVRRMSTERFEALRQYGSLQCCYPKWFLIVKELSRAEAIERYGPVTNEVFGPRGGFKSVTFGHKTFICRELRA
jgi:hypothetical protein